LEIGSFKRDIFLNYKFAKIFCKNGYGVMEIVKLFSYGANMDISTLHQRHIRYIDYREGVLMDYQFKFNKASINRTHSFANIQYRKGAKVVGILSTITIKTRGRDIFLSFVEIRIFEPSGFCKIP